MFHWFTTLGYRLTLDRGGLSQMKFESIDALAGLSGKRLGDTVGPVPPFLKFSVVGNEVPLTLVSSGK